MQPNNASPDTANVNRPVVRGKFLYADGQKFYVKGVTYGTFAPDEAGAQFPPPETVHADFALMAQHGFNAVRTYTVPPTYLLDIAQANGLKVMVGLPWEQHLTFLDTARQRRSILNRVRQGVESCRRHPAVLCFAIGNEVPATIVRWYGKDRIEAFLKRLYSTVKAADPESLVTYVNYPTTEYLSLPFVDFHCFNVYLETPEKMGAYLARLHNLAGDKPLVLAEIGLDSLRNGTDKQAAVLAWQVQTVFGRGCAGMFVFAWTDEWWRGGHPIEDWDFGLVDRQRQPKPALLAVEEAMHSLPCYVERWPLITVAVCTYNGSATISDTLDALQSLSYPNFEVLVVNDGSTDGVAAIVKAYPFRLISTPNRGLASARNTAADYANGEIIAYIDDDAYPDPHWLHYLAYAYANSTHAGIGGPNIAPDEDSAVAHAVANAPGGPVHVLTTDEIAEHIPGCNMSFRREVYQEVSGCDPVYRAAGDDVDLCWRIQQAGYTIGYHPAALVWHHRRSSLKAYWRQQKGYGKAESLLEAKWPQKYNGFGHLSWAGRIYGNGWTMPLRRARAKVFHGTWGSALFQSVYQSAGCAAACLPLMPEWYMVAAFLATVGVLGFWWSPLLWAFLPFALSVTVVLAQAVYSTVRNTNLPLRYRKLRWYLLVAALHTVQPLARLYGRIKFGLTPWRKRGAGWAWRYFPIWRKTFLHWSEKWQATDDYLAALERNLVDQRMSPRRGGDFDRWDLQTGNQLFAAARCLLTVEEHGAGRQYVKLRSVINFHAFSLYIIGAAFCLAALAVAYGQYMVSGVFALFGTAVLVRRIAEKVKVLHSLEVAVRSLSKREAEAPMVAVHGRGREEAEVVAAHGAKLLKLATEAIADVSEPPTSLSQVYSRRKR